MKFIIPFLLLTQICLGQSAETGLISTDLILYNAKIVSGPFTPEYTAMVVQSGKIEALYKNDDWIKKYTSASVIDMQKKFVLPGFIDAHCHFLGLGKAIGEVNLYGTKSWEEAAQRVVDFTNKHPELKWIQGRGWDQNDWLDKEFPTNRLLDSLIPNKYIVLSRIDGHAIIANSLALKYADININSKIDGGKVLTKNEMLTGVLIDNACSILEAKMPAIGNQQKIKWLKAAQDECLQYGITQVADAGLSISDIVLIDSLSNAKELKMRFYLMANPEKETWEYFKERGTITHEKVKWKSIKVYSDGALGSRGALLKKPYCDDKTNYGLQLIKPQSLDSLLTKIYSLGLQANTHCIGDSANSMVLKAYAKVLKTTNDYRWRIEHAQVVDPKDLVYFKNFSIIPSVQPTHATSDMYWAEQRLCKPRMSGAYGYQTLLKNSVFMPLGTDFPVEYVSPFYTIRAARFRQDASQFPKNGFNKKEALTSQQTFAGMTLWAAKGSFWENETGTLEIGKFADFIVLEKNPYKASVAELNSMKVISTYIGGMEVYGLK